MIKIMDRSIWYYIKRPVFSFSLYFHQPAVRTYSMYVMDLIEGDLLEHKDVPPYTSAGGWFVKGTDKKISSLYTSVYIDDILREKKRKMESEKDLNTVKNKIAEDLQSLQGKNETTS